MDLCVYIWEFVCVYVSVCLHTHVYGLALQPLLTMRLWIHCLTSSASGFIICKIGIIILHRTVMKSRLSNSGTGHESGSSVTVAIIAEVLGKLNTVAQMLFFNSSL